MMYEPGEFSNDLEDFYWRKCKYGVPIKDYRVIRLFTYILVKLRLYSE
jgi:hypothetical protein